MELKLDETLRARAKLIEDYQDDQENDEYLDSMLKSEGKVQGMLIMLGIMRSTNMKTELQRAKIRIQHA